MDNAELRELEGWQVFGSAWGPEIERIDSPDRQDAQVVDGDLDAVRVVLQGAIAGKPHALSALDEIGYVPTVFGTLEVALEAVTSALEPGTVNPSLETALDESRLFPDHG